MDYAKVILTFSLMMPAIALSQIAPSEVININSWTYDQTNNQQVVKVNPQTDTYTRNYVTQDNRYVNMVSKANYQATNGRIYTINIEKIGEIDGQKVGKAVTKMARFLPPLALGLEVYELVCSLSRICKKDNEDSWQYWEPGTYNHEYASCEMAIGWMSGTYSQCETIRNNNPGTIHWFRSPAPAEVANNCQLAGTTGWNFAGAGYKNCTNEPEGLRRPVTEQDWTDAEPKLNDPRFDEPLLVNGQPVPLKNPPALGNNPPVKLSDEESIIRDGQGNITGTKRRTTTLELSDGATTTRPGAVNGTEQTTTTTTDANGQPTGTETTINTPPPKADDPKPTAIEFDTVPDNVQIPTQEFTYTFDSTSWGSGYCPQSPSMTLQTSGQLLTFDLQPTCDTLTRLKPFVILLALISAAYIIVGIPRT